MVLCKFFQQGTCRYGSKCHKEHIDVRQIVKTDIESALNGKQWPFSSYGPFKDKPCIPNFIEDQLFEEVRLLCYEAKQKNYFEQFHQQFTKEVMEANNKMKALLQMTPEILDIVMNCYDSTTGNNVSQPSSIIGNSSNTASGQGFGKSGTTLSTPGNIFGSNQAFSSISNANIFGGGMTTAPNIFGNTTSVNQVQTSIFAQSPKTSSSIFGGNSQTQPTIFGQQQAASATTGNLFSQQNPTGMFSQQQTGFGPAQSNNIFSQSNQSSQPSNIFNQGLIQRQPQQGLFAQASTTMQSTQQSAENTPAFGQSATQQNMQNNLFSQVVPQTHNLFNQSAQMQQTTQNTNIFQQSQFNPNNSEHSAHGRNTFKQTSSEEQTGSSTIYSKMLELTPVEIEAFKADCFRPGMLPHNPPPKELVTPNLGGT